MRCDARYPYLAENSVDIAAFWVSLHHFTSEDLIKVIETTKKMLKPNGLLIIFEPNNEFLPRQIVLNTFIKRLVYFDEEEKALIGNHISSLFFRIWSKEALPDRS